MRSYLLRNNKFTRNNMVMFLMFFFLLKAGTGYTQNYPVSATVTVVPPQTTYLGDYAGAGSNKMTVLLLNRDLAEPSLQVRLSIKLEGSGITIQTKPTAQFSPINLNAGVPYMAGGTDLGNYLATQNLDFFGISQANYQQSKSLPEGMYNLCVTVYDYASGRRISEVSCLPLYMTLYDPPILNMPADGLVQTALFPQQMIFSWTDLHMPQPGAMGTDYKFNLWEVPTGLNVADIVNGTQPIYSVTTPVTMLSYGITEPMLDTGKTYVWRVQAIDREGKACFKNAGWSQWSTFKYKANNNLNGTPPIVAAPDGMGHDRITKNSGRGYWDTAFGGAYNGYRVQFRKKEGGTWFTVDAAEGEKIMTQLGGNTKYEWRVQGRRADGDGYGNYSTIDTFTTNGNVLADCGQDPSLAPIPTVPLLQQGYEGMVVHAGMWDMYVTQVVGGGGTFSGKGLVLVPYISKLAGTKSDLLNTAVGAQLAKLPGNFICEFNNVTLDQDYNLIAGEIKVISTGVNGDNIIDFDDYLEGGGGAGGVVTGEPATDIELPDELTLPTTATVTHLDDSTTSVNIGGGSYTVTGDMPATVMDASGDVFTVDNNGKVSQVGTQGPPPLAAGDGNGGGLNILGNKGIIEFKAAPSARFSFDAYQDQYSNNIDLSDEYPRLETAAGNTPYRVPSKFTVAAKGDSVNAFLKTNNGINADSVVFITGKGLKLNAKRNGNNWQMPVIGSNANDGIEVYALYPVAANADSTHTDTTQQYVTLGKIQVVSYERRKTYVKIVPVGNASTNNVNIAALNTEVGKIYDSVGVTMNLVLAPALNDNTWNNGIVVDGTGLFSTESVAMKALQTAYEAQYGKSDTAVLFLLPSLKTTNNQQIEGDMPRGKRYGYLNATTLTTTSLLAGTIAHELGHGIFRLDHTFADHYNIAKGALPENVMDYATPQGGHFNKHQWDAINKPGLVIGVFEGDEDGQSVAVGNIEEIYKLYGQNGKLTFLTPSGQPITIKEKIKEISFSSFEDSWFAEKFNRSTYIPLGTLESFTLEDGRKYEVARPSGSTGPSMSVSSYCIMDASRNCTGNPYVDLESNKQVNNKVVLGFFAIEKSFPIFQIYGVDKKAFGFSNIQVQNYGSGPQKGLFFAADYIKNSTAVNIASDAPELDMSEMLFINQFSSEKISGIAALYILRMSHFLKSMPQLNNCIDLAGVQAAGNVNSSYNQQIASEINRSDGNTSVHIQLPFFIKASIEDIVHTPDYLPELHGVIERMFIMLKMNSQNVVDLDTKEINEIVEILEQKNKIGRECLIRSIPFGVRMQVIKRHTEWTTSNSKEVLMSDLLEYIKSADVQKLLDALAANDYSLYWSLYNDQWYQADKDRLAWILTNHIVNTKAQEMAALNSSIAINSDKYIELCKENVIDRLLFPICKSTSEQSGNDIHVAIMDLGNTFSSNSIKDSYTGSPYDLVKVYFSSDFQFPKLDGKKINQGESIVVPLLWLDWLINKQDNTTNWTVVRIGVDALAVAAAIGTAQPELVVIADAAMAGIDIGFQLASDHIRSTYDKNDAALQVLDGWDNLYAFYGGARIVGGLSKIVFNKQNWVNAINTAKATPGKIKGTATLAYNLYKIVKNSNGTFNVVATTYKTVLGNVLYKVAIETELASHCTKLDEIALVLQNNKFVVCVKAGLKNTAYSVADGVMPAATAADLSGLALTNLRKLPTGATGATVVETLKDIKVIGYAEPVTFDIVKANDAYYVSNIVEQDGLAKYPNIRKYLGDGRVKAYLNTAEMKVFEPILRSANVNVLKEMDNFSDGAYFAEMVRGYRQNPDAFKAAIISVDKFSGQYGWLSYWNSAPDMKTALETMEGLITGNKLQLSVGDATDLQLAAIHSFTVDGNFFNIPLRYTPQWATQYSNKLLTFAKEGLDELRKVPGRVVKDEVYSGRSFSIADFESTFVGGANKIHNYPGFVSSSRLTSVAEGFVELTKQWAGQGEKIAVIQRVTSKNGVYIDDFSDWGKNLGKTRHGNADLAIQIQEEVIFNPGNFRQIGEPILIMENGVAKTIHGLKAYYVDFIQIEN